MKSFDLLLPVVLCKQSYDCCQYAYVTMMDICEGYAWHSCPECNNTGVFVISDDLRQTCNVCKGYGQLPVILE